MSANDDVEMNGIGVNHHLIFKECDNYDEVWGVSPVPDDSGSITSYAPSEISDKEYAVQIKRRSNMEVDDCQIINPNGVSSLGTPINLEYLNFLSQQGLVSQAANDNSSTRQQCVLNEDITVNHLSSSNVFNIQLNYDPNQVLDLNS